MTQEGITSFADNKKQTLIQPDKTGANVIKLLLTVIYERS
jgi:hypothetical protein